MSARKCGDCTACCVYPAVPAINKPAGKPCQFLGKCSGGSCTIYEMRPVLCREYECPWLQGHGAEDDRPDKIGALVDYRDTQFGNVLVARALTPGACQRPPAQKAIRRLSKRTGKVCLIVSDDVNDNQRVKQIIGAPKVLANFKREFPTVKLYDDGTAKQKVT